MNDEISQDDFLAAFGISQETATNDNKDDATDNQNTADQTNTGDADQANPSSDNQDNTNQDESQNGETDENQNANQNNDQTQNDTNKSAQAFAAMRVKLNQTEKMLDNVCSVLGLDPKAKDSMDQLQTKLTEALAKKQGIPAATLERLNQLEEKEQQRELEQVRNNAFLGFQNIKDEFKLSDQELQEFANQLVAEGKNPFVQKLDLMTEYKLKNFDKLLAQAKAAGAQAESARAAKANNNASTPGTNQGGSTDQEVTKITTVKQLTDWMNQQGNKN